MDPHPAQLTPNASDGLRRATHIPAPTRLGHYPAHTNACSRASYALDVALAPKGTNRALPEYSLNASGTQGSGWDDAKALQHPDGRYGNGTVSANGSQISVSIPLSEMPDLRKGFTWFATSNVSLKVAYADAPAVTAEQDAWTNSCPPNGQGWLTFPGTVPSPSTSTTSITTSPPPSQTTGTAPPTTLPVAGVHPDSPTVIHAPSPALLKQSIPAILLADPTSRWDPQTVEASGHAPTPIRPTIRRIGPMAGLRPPPASGNWCGLARVQGSGQSYLRPSCRRSAVSNSGGSLSQRGLDANFRSNIGEWVRWRVADRAGESPRSVVKPTGPQSGPKPGQMMITSKRTERVGDSLAVGAPPGLEVPQNVRLYPRLEFAPTAGPGAMFCVRPTEATRAGQGERFPAEYGVNPRSVDS